MSAGLSPATLDACCGPPPSPFATPAQDPGVVLRMMIELPPEIAPTAYTLVLPLPQTPRRSAVVPLFSAVKLPTQYDPCFAHGEMHVKSQALAVQMGVPFGGAWQALVVPTGQTWDELQKAAMVSVGGVPEQVWGLHIVVGPG